LPRNGKIRVEPPIKDISCKITHGWKKAITAMEPDVSKIRRLEILRAFILSNLFESVDIQ
jgi:hypothetical protein